MLHDAFKVQNDIHVLFPIRIIQSTVVPKVTMVHVCSMRYEKFHYFYMALRGSDTQRCPPILVDAVRFHTINGKSLNEK